MKISFKATAGFMTSVRGDLDRPHRFASERVGFISTKAALAGRKLILIAEKYYPVDDSEYIDDETVGAMISQEAIRKALEIALKRRVGMFHVHTHEHLGSPGFSRTDISEQDNFVPDFFSVQGELPHGAIVLSRDRAAGRVWISRAENKAIDEFCTVGSRFLIDLPRATRYEGGSYAKAW